MEDTEADTEVSGYIVNRAGNELSRSLTVPGEGLYYGLFLVESA